MLTAKPIWPFLTMLSGIVIVVCLASHGQKDFMFLDGAVFIVGAWWAMRVTTGT